MLFRFGCKAFNHNQREFVLDYLQANIKEWETSHIIPIIKSLDCFTNTYTFMLDFGSQKKKKKIKEPYIMLQNYLTDLFFAKLVLKSHSPCTLSPLPNLSLVRLTLYHRMPQYLGGEAGLMCELPSKSQQAAESKQKELTREIACRYMH